MEMLRGGETETGETIKHELLSSDASEYVNKESNALKVSSDKVS
jgi:hypothetical protein